jgi:hypothetical protein
MVIDEEEKPAKGKKVRGITYTVRGIINKVWKGNRNQRKVKR